MTWAHADYHDTGNSEVVWVIVTLFVLVVIAWIADWIRDRHK